MSNPEASKAMYFGRMPSVPRPQIYVDIRPLVKMLSGSWPFSPDVDPVVLSVRFKEDSNVFRHRLGSVSQLRKGRHVLLHPFSLDEPQDTP